MRKTFIGLAATTAILFNAAAAFAAEVTIRYSSWVPATHWYYKMNLEPYFADIEKATEGRVKIEVLPKAIGTPQSQFDVVHDGLADMSWIIAGYTPGRFPLAEMGELPFSGDTTSTGPAFQRIYMEKFSSANEFDGVELLAIYTGSAGHVATRKKQIKTVEDFAGLKLRSAAKSATESLNLLGAVPILKSAAEAFEMLSTGAIDGSLMIPETVVSANAIDLLDTFTIIPDGFFNTVHGMIINKAKWDQIPAEDQAKIKEVSGEVLARRVGESYAAMNSGAFEAMKAKGYDIITMSDAEAMKLKTKLAPIEQSWIDAAKAKGIADPASVLGELRAEAKSK